jgi:hypothetical protein
VSAPTLNAAQLALLRLIVEAGSAGCLVYGRGPAATADALARRGLVQDAGRVKVASMGQVETRSLYMATHLGFLAAAGDAMVKAADAAAPPPAGRPAPDAAAVGECAAVFQRPAAATKELIRNATGQAGWRIRRGAEVLVDFVPSDQDAEQIMREIAEHDERQRQGGGT